MHTVDTKGHLCPEPLIMTRNALKEAKAGEKILVVSDHETSCQNLMSFLSDLGANPLLEQKEGQYFIEATKPEETTSVKETNPDSYCNMPQGISKSSDYVVVARGSGMGEGDEELGNLLIRGYFNALKSNDDLPTNIIMYNGGVKLALKDTDTAESLAELEDKGVSIIVCGTCVDYYQIKEKVAVGRISNMYQIATKLAEAGHVVYL